MSSNCPTTSFIFSHKYCSVDIVVVHMCFMFHVMSLPVFMPHMVCECPLMSLPLTSTITLHVQGLPIFSLHCYCRSCRKMEGSFLSIIVLNAFLISLKGLILDIIVFKILGSLFILGSRPHIILLNSIMAGLGSSALMGVECIYKRTRLISCLASRQFYLYILQTLSIPTPCYCSGVGMVML